MCGGGGWYACVCVLRGTKDGKQGRKQGSKTRSLLRLCGRHKHSLSALGLWLCPVGDDDVLVRWWW